MAKRQKKNKNVRWYIRMSIKLTGVSFIDSVCIHLQLFFFTFLQLDLFFPFGTAFYDLY
jgi:hypothetical protein